MYRFYNISTVGNQFSVANSSPVNMNGSWMFTPTNSKRTVIIVAHLWNPNSMN